MNAARTTPDEAGEMLVAFRGVSKSFDARTFAVESLDLEIREGEFLTLLGPSGSGKTTTLMMLAGFEQADAGEILLRGRSLDQRPPHRRNMGVVFQSYALFPHMTVGQNLAFPLRVRGIRARQVQEKVREILELVGLAGLENRRPHTLSGGQQQRVALARALIFDPDIVLMDEPLGALDRKLRERLQDEIKRVHRRLGITIVYVTHDQSEALMLSDRIAIFERGRLQQIGDPRSIYDRPANAFVAGFVGDNNLLQGVVVENRSRYCTVRVAGARDIRALPANALRPGAAATVAIRPQQIAVGQEARNMANCFEAHIDDYSYHGDHGRIRARLGDGIELLVHRPGRPLGASSLTIGWPAELCLAFAATETAR
jgi:putative spermidine/putrescine transport system ATP-binding protein